MVMATVDNKGSAKNGLVWIRKQSVVVVVLLITIIILLIITQSISPILIII